MKLEALSWPPPAEFEQMLLELGDGDSGFSGTPVASGEMSLQEYVEQAMRSSQGLDDRPGYVPQTIYCMMAEGVCVGMLRMRHYLNDALRRDGGHVGYYVRPAHRNRGYAGQALAQVLAVLDRLGEKEVMLTVSPDNAASQAVVRAQGGVVVAETEALLKFLIKLP